MSQTPNEKDNPNKDCGNYSVNFSQSDLINIYVKEWVLKWCRKEHPEAFYEAEKYIKKKLNKNKNKNKKKGSNADA